MADIAPKTTASETNKEREERAYDLHKKVASENPDRNTKVTIGREYGDGVTIETKTEKEAFFDGVVVGVIGVAAAAGLVAVIVKTIKDNQKK